MATVYTINGEPAILAPHTQRWRQVQVGTDHTQRPIYQATWEIDMEFDSCTIEMGNQWLQAASAASANITVLDRYSVEYTDLSGIQLIINSFPAKTAAYYQPFSLKITGVTI